MSSGTLVVLVVGIAVISWIFAKKKGFSNNQRIVLSGVAIGLLAYSFAKDGDRSKMVLLAAAVVIIVAGLIRLRRQ